ncbi:hypothetical protein N9V91_01440 [Acidimicrobiaceae bacterium]|nr:hypothetical protein [Acidimicrobiaceae bacterium]
MRSSIHGATRVIQDALDIVFVAAVASAGLGGTGWLLVKGGLEVMAGFGVELADAPELFSGDVARFWISGCAIGIVTWLICEICLITSAERSAQVVAKTDAFALGRSKDRQHESRDGRPDLGLPPREFIKRGQVVRVVSLSEGLARTR